MRVGFDVSVLHRPHPRGVVRVVERLVGALEERGRLEVLRLEPPPHDGATGGLALWRQRTLPREVGRLGLIGIHSFTSAFPALGRGRRVQTIHEVPWRHGVRENAGAAHRFWAGPGRVFADRVVCPTEHVARDLRRGPLGSVPGAAGKLRVVPWGIDATFRDEPPAGVVDEVVLGRYRLGEDPIALCLGAVRPKKNLAAVLRGLAELRRRDGPALQVLITGGDSPQLRRDLGLASSLGLSRWVSTHDDIEEQDLPSLLRLSTVVPVLSHSEGFGLPVLEALACGTPVLVPPDSAQAEVAGEQGFVVDPADPAAVADGLARAVAEREELRYGLSERARTFTWQRAAEHVEALWEELAR